MDNAIIPTPTLTGRLRAIPTLSGRLRASPTLTGNLNIPVYIDVDIYGGVTMVTPSEETQVLDTQNKTVLSDIIINPIPPNYGLITWNGFEMTVS